MTPFRAFFFAFAKPFSPTTNSPVKKLLPLLLLLLVACHRVPPVTETADGDSIPPVDTLADLRTALDREIRVANRRLPHPLGDGLTFTKVNYLRDTLTLRIVNDESVAETALVSEFPEVLQTVAARMIASADSTQTVLMQEVVRARAAFRLLIQSRDSDAHCEIIIPPTTLDSLMQASL